jgi:hypothetical protein
MGYLDYLLYLLSMHTLLVLIRRVKYITEVSSKLNRKTDNTKYNTQKKKGQPNKQ